jgi:hypothetical protein
VLGLHALGHLLGAEPAETIGLADEARSWLAAGPAHRDGSGLLARVMAAASQARSHELGQNRDAGETLSAAAVTMARASGDASDLGFCLMAQHDAIWRAGSAGRRLALADEMASAARAGQDTELELLACHLTMVALLESGDPRCFAEQRGLAALAARTRMPRFRYLALSRQGTIATFQGRFADARRDIDEALALGRQIGEAEHYSVWHDQAWELARLQGRQDQIEALIATDQTRGDPLAVVLEAVSELEAGDSALAQAHAAELAELGRRWPQWAALMWLTIQARLAAASGDPALCATVRAAIGPLRDQWAVLGGAVVCHGPMAYWAALVEAADRQWDDAIANFRAAEQMARRLGARPWSVLARLGLAQALIGRDGPGDAADAAGLLESAAADAGRLGMRPAARQAGRLREAGPRVPARPDADGPVLRFDGMVWTMTFGGRSAVLPDAKGLHDLHALLARPGTSIPAAVLLNPAGGAAVTGSYGSGAAPVLDEEAKARYRARLGTLEEQITAALDRGDDDRAARLDAERGALVEELRRASGLGGRARRLDDHAERARKTVTARIRDALRRIDQRHPPLAAHLRATVSTGSSCCYQPRPASRSSGR